MHGCVMQYKVPVVASSCGSTFHGAALSLWSSSWIWVGHSGTDPEQRLLLPTERHRSRPPPRGSPPGPEVTGSQLSRRRKTHRHQPTAADPPLRREEVTCLTWHCTSDVLLAGVPVLCPTHSCIALTQSYYCYTGEVLGKTQNRYSDTVMSFIVFKSDVTLCYRVDSVEYSASAFLQCRSRAGQGKQKFI